MAGGLRACSVAGVCSGGGWEGWEGSRVAPYPQLLYRTCSGSDSRLSQWPTLLVGSWELMGITWSRGQLRLPASVGAGCTSGMHGSGFPAGPQDLPAKPLILQTRKARNQGRHLPTGGLEYPS